MLVIFYLTFATYLAGDFQVMYAATLPEPEGLSLSAGLGPQNEMCLSPSS